jgi:N-acetylneuraminic acid mutarotase
MRAGLLVAALAGALVAAGQACATISWATKAAVPAFLAFPAVTAVDGKVYAIGGYNSGGLVYLNTCYAYDPASDTWTPMAPMSVARAEATAVAVGCRIFVFGGENSSSSYLDTVEVYDTRRNEWKTMGRAPMAVRSIVGAAISNKVYLAGGMNAWYWNTFTGIYSPYQDSWNYGPGPAYARDLAGGGGLAGCLHLVGGQETTLAFSNRNESFNPVTQVWSTRQILGVRPIALSAAEVQDRLYSVGGYMYTGATTYVASYNPLTNIWTAEDRLPSARWGHGCASAGGKVYLVGGVDAGMMISTTLFEGTVAGYTPPQVGALDAAIAISSTTLSVGRWVRVDLTVTNIGFGTVNSVWPEVAVASSTLMVVPIKGPYPAPLFTLAGGEATTFSWTVSISGAGPLSLTLTATGESGGYCVEEITGFVGATTPRQAGLVTSFRVEPSGALLGQTIQAVLSVNNPGQVDLTVTVSLGESAGATYVQAVSSPPVLGPVTITATGSASFTWVFMPVDTGTVVFVARAGGMDSFYGYESSSSDSASARIEMPVARAWPNPYIPARAVGGTFKFKDLLPRSKVRIYTVSGIEVWSADNGDLTRVEWNGKNMEGEPVVPGAYFWTAECERYKSRQRGTILVRR